MTVVLSMQNKRVPLAQALRVPSQLWRCAECGELVHLRQYRNKQKVTHLSPTCSVSPEIQAIRAKAETLAKQIAKRGFVQISALPGSTLDGEFATVPVEKVVPFMTSGLRVPAVLVQSYWTAFVIGVITTDDYDSAFFQLQQATEDLNCGVLAAEISGFAFEEELSILFEPEDTNFAIWVTPVAPGRVPRKWLLFEEILDVNQYAATVVREIRVSHFNAHEPSSKRHYAQDILHEMRVKSWRAWAKKAVWEQNWIPDWFDWIDIAGQQVPVFWALFWFVKHSFLVKELQVHMDALAEKFVKELAPDNDDDEWIRFIADLFDSWAKHFVEEGKLVQLYEGAQTYVPLIAATGYVEVSKLGA